MMGQREKLAHLRRLDVAGSPNLSPDWAKRLAIATGAIAERAHLAITEADIQRRAPDPASLVAARKIAVAADWLALGYDRRRDRVWGEYEGRDHYYVYAHLRDRAVGCGCGSPKNPCKHALALLLLAANRHEFREAPIPDAMGRNASPWPRRLVAGAVVATDRSEATMHVGIIGSGLMGGKLGTLFARAGHDVVFSYAHSHRKLEKLAKEAGARAGTPREAAEHADAVLLAVHWSRIDDAVEQAGLLSGRVIVTCSLPMNADDTALAVAHTSSGAEELARKLPKARVAAAFNTVPSEVLFPVYEARERANRPSLIYYGDDEHAKKVAATLIRDVGFDAVDAGPLRIARYAEPFGLLVAQLAYEGSSGPELAYRFERVP